MSANKERPVKHKGQGAHNETRSNRDKHVLEGFYCEDSRKERDQYSENIGVNVITPARTRLAEDNEGAD